MFLTHRHPRFTLLLAALHITVLLFLLPYSPFAPFHPSSPPRLPSHHPILYQGLSARVRRAERAYQKTLRARDALVAKVGPTPPDVVLCVRLLLFRGGIIFILAQISTGQGTVASIYRLYVLRVLSPLLSTH
jgi:hypothetical protein